MINGINIFTHIILHINERQSSFTLSNVLSYLRCRIVWKVRTIRIHIITEIFLTSVNYKTERTSPFPLYSNT